MSKYPYINRNLFLFVLITALSIGAVIVYAMNHMEDPQDNNSQTLGNRTQASQKTNQADNQTLQNFDINNQQQQQTQPQAQVEEDQAGGAANPTQAQQAPTNVTELQMRDEVVGAGQEVKNGDTVEVNYLGTFLDGSKFDSSYDRNQTFDFTVGAGEVIRGWDLGLVGMKVGGKRILLIPSDLAYGQRGAPGAIPPNTPLKFEIELVSIR